MTLAIAADCSDAPARMFTTPTASVLSTFTRWVEVTENTSRNRMGSTRFSCPEGISPENTSCVMAGSVIASTLASAVAPMSWM